MQKKDVKSAFGEVGGPDRGSEFRVRSGGLTVHRRVAAVQMKGEPGLLGGDGPCH